MTKEQRLQKKLEDVMANAQLLRQKLQKATNALNNVVECENGDKDFEYEDTVEIASRALEAIDMIDGF